jgi:hypothetical protein
LIHDIPQSNGKFFALEAPIHGRKRPEKGGIMNTILMIAANAFSAETDHSLRGIALLSCCGLAVSLCLMAFGVDLNTL